MFIFVDLIDKRKQKDTLDNIHVRRLYFQLSCIFFFQLQKSIQNETKVSDLYIYDHNFRRHIYKLCALENIYIYIYIWNDFKFFCVYSNVNIIWYLLCTLFIAMQCMKINII